MRKSWLDLALSDDAERMNGALTVTHVLDIGGVRYRTTTDGARAHLVPASPDEPTSTHANASNIASMLVGHLHARSVYVAVISPTSVRRAVEADRSACHAKHKADLAAVYQRVHPRTKLRDYERPTTRMSCVRIGPAFVGSNYIVDAISGCRSDVTVKIGEPHDALVFYRPGGEIAIVMPIRDPSETVPITDVGWFPADALHCLAAIGKLIQDCEAIRAADALACLGRIGEAIALVCADGTAMRGMLLELDIKPHRASEIVYTDASALDASERFALLELN